MRLHILSRIKGVDLFPRTSEVVIVAILRSKTLWINSHPNERTDFSGI